MLCPGLGSQTSCCIAPGIMGEAVQNHVGKLDLEADSAWATRTEASDFYLSNFSSFPTVWKEYNMIDLHGLCADEKGWCPACCLFNNHTRIGFAIFYTSAPLR